MATQSVEFSAPSGQTVTVRLFSAGSDTVVQTASAVAEATNRDGVYTATFTDAAAGLYRLIATNSGGTLLAQWWVDLTLTTATFQAYEMPASVIQSGLSTLDAAGVRTAVGLASANLDTQLADLPTVSEFEARTLAATEYFDPASDTVTVGAMSANTVTASALASDAVTEIQSGLSTFDANSDEVTLTTTSVDAIGDAFLSHTIEKGDPGSIERAFWQVSKAAASFDGSVQTSGSNTAASFLTDISVDDYAGQVLVFVSGSLSGQARAITSVVSGVVTVQTQFTEAPSSGDEFLVLPQQVYSISQIQNGLATSAALDVVDGIVDQLKTRSGYTLSILAGAISNAQNAAEAYTITLDGTAYGVTYSGLDSSGNRTGATLTET